LSPKHFCRLRSAIRNRPIHVGERLHPKAGQLPDKRRITLVMNDFHADRVRSEAGSKQQVGVELCNSFFVTRWHDNLLPISCGLTGIFVLPSRLSENYTPNCVQGKTDFENFYSVR
jgi:hypothetical protein